MLYFVENVTYSPDNIERDGHSNTDSYLSIVILGLSSVAIIAFIVYGSLRLKTFFLRRRRQDPVPEENHYNTILDSNLCTETEFQ
jgi:hypothetical protein